MVFWASQQGLKDKGVAVMSEGVARKLLAVLLSAGLGAIVMGCSLSLPSLISGGETARLEDEPEKIREVSGAPPTGVEPAVSADARRERKKEGLETSTEAGGLEAAAEDYRVITSFSDLGVVEIVLEGKGIARGAWQSANAEAAKRCRAWGYEEAAANAPVQRVRLYRCEGKTVSAGRLDRNRAAPALWRTGEFRRVLWNFRGRAEQGDEQALQMVQGMADRRGDLERRAQRGGAKAWTHWMFSELMTSDGEVRGDSWQCFAAGSDWSGKPQVMLARLEEAGAALGVGEVSASGASHPAVFSASGPALRWEYGSGHWQQLPHAFVIDPDGGGYQLDVSSSETGQVESRRAFDCQVMR